MVNFRSGIIRKLVDGGSRVVVVAPPDAYVDELKLLGAEYIEWSLTGRGTHIGSEASSVWHLARIYKAIRPDVAYHFTIKSVIYGSLVARLFNIPFVSVVTGLGYVFINRNWTSRIAISLYRATLRQSTEVWLLNSDDRAALDSLHLLDGVFVRMLPGEGVDTAFFAPRPSAPSKITRFLLVARMLRDKGILEYVECARRVKAEGHAAEFALLGPVGADNPTAVSMEQIDQWVAEGSVVYLGMARDVRPYIANADCVVLPSYREGLPRSLLEASSMGKPVIATQVPGCKDVVKDGVTGLLCRAQDASDLTEKVLSFLGLAEPERECMGDNGRSYVVEKFDERLILNHYRESLLRIGLQSDGKN